MSRYDFSGWATRNNLVCSDGRVIMHNAFIDNDGQIVPLVWNHQHNSPDNVLGHALLKNRDDGVYAYGTFNDTEAGRTAKELVVHGDICSLSIFANQLKQQGPNVVHGMIREVSLVHAGANPGAYIENVVSHGDDSGDSAILYNGYALTLYHSDSEIGRARRTKEDEDDMASGERTVEDILDTMNDEQKDLLYRLVGLAAETGGDLEDYEEYDDEEFSHSDFDDEVTADDIIDTMNDEQKDLLYEMVGLAAETGGDFDDEDYDDDFDDEDYDDDFDDEDYDDDYNDDFDDEDYDFEEEDEEDMKHNAFESTGYYGSSDFGSANDSFTHSQMETIISDAKRYGSLKESFLAHKDEYGIKDIDWLFPDYKNLDNPPEFIKRNMDWVDRLMNRVKHTPFTRIKSMFANITEDEARAKGYIKGNLKKEEVFSLLKRTTDPTTIYKKQKLDRDDVIDITDFDVISWLKTEMRMMLDEEIARAILIGDGRLPSEEDHIKEDHVRPIWTDDDLFTIKVPISITAETKSEDKAKMFITSAIKARKNYQGSGNPILFTTEDLLTDMLLLTDTLGRDLYESVSKLAVKLRVSDIVTVPVMENQERTDVKDGSKKKTLAGIIVNPSDYNVGADKGGAISMFDDFDIDYNQMKYLIETRCSGALVVPYSAIALEYVVNPQ